MISRQKKEWRAGRVIYYQNKADADYWDNYWRDSITNEYYRRYEDGELDEYSSLFLMYLKKADRILEAGCGTARYVLALKSRGYENIEGIEWGTNTVDLVKSIYPDLPIRVGDATIIDVPDKYFDVYISLGVIEHRIEGPEPFLNEAYRVLRNGGLAIFTVPYVHPIRELKGRLGLYKNKGLEEIDFYQYAYSKKELSNFLIASGFQIILTKPIAGYRGIIREFPGFPNLLDRMPFGKRLKKYLRSSSWIDVFGHVCCYVVRKP